MHHDQRHISAIVILIFTFALIGAAPQATRPATQPATQPDAPQPTQQDPRAVALAERVVKRVGGMDAWNDARYITWNFFGARTHVWDKQRMRDRIDYTTQDGDDHTYVIDLGTSDGRAWINDKPVTDPDKLDKLMEQAYAMWVNDSYWLAMPFKLFDPGVKLRHAGERELEGGVETEVLELTFDNDTGLTPENKYDVFVDPKTTLIVQWDYYKSAAQRGPTLSTPWDGWKRFDGLWFSIDRGELRGIPAKLTDIAVFDELPNVVFTEPQKPQLPDN